MENVRGKGSGGQARDFLKREGQFLLPMLSSWSRQVAIDEVIQVMGRTIEAVEIAEGVAGVKQAGRSVVWPAGWCGLPVGHGRCAPRNQAPGRRGG